MLKLTTPATTTFSRGGEYWKQINNNNCSHVPCYNNCNVTATLEHCFATLWYIHTYIHYACVCIKERDSMWLCACVCRQRWFVSQAEKRHTRPLRWHATFKSNIHGYICTYVHIICSYHKNKIKLNKKKIK